MQSYRKRLDGRLALQCKAIDSGYACIITCYIPIKVIGFEGKYAIKYQSCMLE